ncbi:MAG: hypothetical protein ACOCP4_03510 [Candidatus Woesearchaeota archaeon]
MKTTISVVFLVILSLLFFKVSFSQDSDKHIPNVKNGNYKASSVSVYLDGVRQGSKYTDVIFNFRDSILYTSSPGVFHDIVFIDDWKQYEETGTVFKKNLGYDDGNFTLNVNIAYRQGEGITLDEDEDPWIIIISYKDLELVFAAHKTDEVLHRTKETIKMHQMHKGNYTEEEINKLLKHFGFD